MSKQQKKYEFVEGDVKVIWPGRVAKRIRALVTIAAIGVQPGHLGGYIETDFQLNDAASDEAWVSGEAQVYDSARVSGKALVSGKASRTPLALSGLTWHVTIIDTHMQIGCQYHALTAWRDFDDATIAVMDGRDALRFWRSYKTMLLGLAEADGRFVVSQPQEKSE
jgi:hypothetical protein